MRILPISVAFYGEFATFSDFEKTQGFFEKPIYFFNKNPKFWTFWILLLKSHSTANLLLLMILKKNQDVFRKTHLILKKTQISNVLNPTISVAFHSKFATFNDFEKNQEVFRKTHLI